MPANAAALSSGTRLPANAAAPNSIEHHLGITPLAVARYIVAAYWFTVSTSFANPAVTAAHAFSNMFAGIRPADVGGLLVAQAIGAAAGALVFSWFVSTRTATA